MPLLKIFGFSADGWGLASILHAMLEDTDYDYYVNDRFSLVLEGFGCSFLSPYQWTSTVGVRYFSGTMAGLLMMAMQKFVPVSQAARSSVESYGEALQDELYQWSRDEVGEWLRSPNSRVSQ